MFRSERDQGGLFRVSSEGGPETQLTSFGVHPVWSADGTQVLFRTNALSREGRAPSMPCLPMAASHPAKSLRRFARSGNWTWLAPHPDGRVSAIGQHLKSGPGFYTSSRDGTKAFAWKLGKDGQCTQLAQTTQRFQWNADGTALYVEAVLNEVRNVWRVRVDPETLEWVAAERMTAGAGQDVAAALAPVGGRMAFSVQQQSTRLWVFPLDASTGRITGQGTPFTPEDGRAQTASLSPDGRLAAFALVLAGRSRAELMVTDLDTNKTEVFAASAYGTTWSPDSRTLAYMLTRPDRGASRGVGAGGAGSGRFGTDHPPLDQGLVSGADGLDAGWQIHHRLVYVSALYREGEARALAADAVSGTDRARADRRTAVAGSGRGASRRTAAG